MGVINLKKQVICFANSRKRGGKCFAGKEFNNCNSWIRPVSDRQDESLSLKEECILGDKCNCYICNPVIPNLLDVIEIDVSKNVGKDHQTENYLISNTKWKKLGRLDSSYIDRYFDSVNSELWVDGYDTYYGINDRFPTSKAVLIKDSLKLIEVNNLIISVNIEGIEFYDTHKKVRGKFVYNNKQYIIPITDPIIEQKYLLKDKGDYIVGGNKRKAICLSIGKSYKDFIYKFIAGIIIF